MKMIRILSLTAIAALILVAATAYAATYDWTFEGDYVPTPAAQSTENPPEVTTDGSILKVDFTNWATVEWWAAYGTFSNTTPAWTIDFRMARPVAEGSWGNTNNGPDYVNIYASGTGTAGRISFYLGRSGYGGLGGRRIGDPDFFDDSSTLTIYTVETGMFEVVVPGLNVGVLNDYRIVGTGGGSYKIYVNGIVDPVYTGTLTGTSTYSGISYGAQFEAATTPTDMDLLLDYLRVNNSTAYDEAPVKAGIEGNITLQNFPNDADKLALSPVKVELMQGTTVLDTKIVTLSTNPGPYVFPGLATGTYKLRFTASKFLAKEVPDLVVVEGARTPADVTLLSGDLDGDNQVTSSDLSAVLQNM